MKIRKHLSGRRTGLWILFAAFALSLFLNVPSLLDGAKASQSKQKKQGKPINYDIRVNGGQEAIDMLQSRAPVLARAHGMTLNIKNAASAQKEQSPTTDVKFSDLIGTVEVVESQTGALTAAAPGRDGFDIVRDYLRANSAVYGISESEVDRLHFIGESVSPSGLRMVRFEQVINGAPVFQSETRAILDKDGRLIRTLGLLVPGIDYAEPATNLISPEQAFAESMSKVGIALDAGMMTSSKQNMEATRISAGANNSLIKGDVSSKLIYFPLAPGILIPAYSQVAFTGTSSDWYTIVDAQKGETLWRKNIRSDVSTHEARFRVYVQADGVTPADSPAPHSPSTNTVGLGTQYAEIAPTIVNMSVAQNITASPNGWINDCPGGGCTANETQTIGNNVHAYMDAQSSGGNNNLPDTVAAFVLDGNGKPTGNPDANGRNRDFLGTTPRDFQTNYLPPPVGGNPEAGQTCTGNGSSGTAAIDQFRRGMVTHLFYLSNWYHDQLYNLGFNEAAGNFQLTNFSGMGSGNDRVLAEADDVSGTNNANFSTPADGSSGRMQMYRFTGSTIDRDGGLDAEIVIHELTHGTSNRLIGNAVGLNWDVGQGMGEGWSDFYAMSLLNNTNADNPNGLYATGAYATYKFLFPSISPAFLDNYVYGIRRFPYTTDNTINPMTWADVDDVTNNLSGGIAPDPLGNNIGGAMEVHNAGEVWCLTLWEVRSRIIADPAGANGDVPTGNHTMLQLITDAMKMTPISPSFTDARDAIIAADGATHSYANEESIWAGFADRGLGYNAYAPQTRMFGYTAGHLGIRESFLVPYLDKGTVTFSDSTGGNGNGGIDPGEQLTLNVPLKNPWHLASKGVASATATLTSSTPGVTIVNGNSTYPAIAAQATTSGTPFTIRIASSVTCGQALDFTVTTSSSLGASTINFRLRVGTPSGTGAPVTYTKTIPSPFLAIPDGPRPRGVMDSMTVSDDFEIADLNFRVDDIHHTFTGDLTVMLKGPDGHGNEMVAAIGGLIDGGSGDNIINMVIDDEASPTADQLQATPAQAPYTSSWLPVFNSPGWAIAGFGPQDPVATLGRFDGTSTKGTWTVVVSDQFAVDTGTLRGWSIIVTPVAYTCTPFTCPAPTITCPANVTKSNDPNQCGAVVTYPAPTVTSNCSTPGTVTCSPASGSFFPVGTTTVTCNVSDDLGHSSSCSFTVTVNDTQPPVITCPANKTAVTPNISSTCATVNFTTTASDNCPGVVVVCNPPSGSCFPLGVTTVTCTATDASGNTATCSFTISVFNVCLQDDSNPGTVFLGNSVSGAYRFCCAGTIFTGTASVTKIGSVITFTHNPPDRRVTARVDGTTLKGTASLQSPPGTTKCTITDNNTTNNSCNCQ